MKTCQNSSFINIHENSLLLLRKLFYEFFWKNQLKVKLFGTSHFIPWHLVVFYFSRNILSCFQRKVEYKILDIISLLVIRMGREIKNLDIVIWVVKYISPSDIDLVMSKSTNIYTYSQLNLLSSETISAILIFWLNLVFRHGFDRRNTHCVMYDISRRSIKFKV